MCLIKETDEKVDIPIEKVYDIYVFGDLDINSDLMEFLGSRGVCLHFFNYYGYYAGSFYARERAVSGSLLVQQVAHYVDPIKRVELARRFVTGSAENMIRNLKYYEARGKDLQKAISTMQGLLDSIEQYAAVPECMGVEGNIRKCYYETWNTVVDQTIDFERRVKRPPDNMINSLISFLNSAMYTATLSEIYKTQLNPTISYLHEPGDKRFSLSLDVAEIFKPLIVDRLIFQVLNKNMITEDDFMQSEECIRFKDASLKKIMRLFDDKMLTTIQHRTLHQNVTYRHLIRLELYKLIKHLIGDQQYKPFKIWW